MHGLGFAIDRGGTFTDVCVFHPSGKTEVLKVLSEDPDNYSDAPTEAIRRVIERETGCTIDRETPIPTDKIEWIRMGTTVATNALLERKGERIALVTTAGFGDLLFIGNQSRPRIFDFDIKIPEVLYEDVVEVNERVVPADPTCEMNQLSTEVGNKVLVEEVVNEEKLRADLQKVQDKGIHAIAVVLLHSFLYPEHELVVQRVASSLGFTNISLSHQVMPMIKAVPRGFTVCADAYLTPKIKEYLHGFSKGFQDLSNVRVNFMQSDGGLCDIKNFFGSRAILSGPAGGVVGVALTAYDETSKQPVIGFDMGGTSTDVCRYSGALEHVMETTTAGVTIQAPQLDIQTVAAGGGSRLFFRDGLFLVGPESAGAHPGPVCYKKHGYLAVTDANLVLGRILPEYFPKIFGPHADEPLDRKASVAAMEQLTAEINEYVSNNPGAITKSYTVEEVALGFLSVANEEMCRPIRLLTQARGFDTSAHALACFGGAGGQHACAIARVLGIGQVIVHKYAGVLSAYGIALADVVSEQQEPVHLEYSEENFQLLHERFAALTTRAHEDLERQGFTDDDIQCKYFLHMRYEWTDCAIMVAADYNTEDKSSLLLFSKEFNEAYKREFGFVLEKRGIVVDDIRIRGIGRSGVHTKDRIAVAENCLEPPVTEIRVVYFQGGYKNTNVYELPKLKAGHEIHGAALIIDANSTVVVEPDCTALITDNGNIRIRVEDNVEKDITTKVDPIRLAIFSNRFMSIAEQMGRVLQRTSISTNMKERLDFSCALFGPEGDLIANAPHIPVHLGGMQYAVRFQLNHRGVDDLKDGDVILSNHPKAGGSHLPDLTVITPVFYPGRKEPVFFLANRGHHADIGGLVPGSMPPNATNINQEGANFVSFKLVNKGEFQEEELIQHLMDPAKTPGCSGTRNLSDNISDLKAQIAANNKGISLVSDLITEYSLPVVQAYMAHIQSTAEETVRNMLKTFGAKIMKETGTTRLNAEDFMDNGSPIRLTIDVDLEKGSALFDFEGTGPEFITSLNAPKAVTMSAIIYCLRCLVAKDIPLNSGCLAPITIKIPPGSLLDPTEEAAVVAGNVLTSQRLCDVIFKAFGAVAASQVTPEGHDRSKGRRFASTGCMNNVTFGDEKMGYYETIAGGAGAGPGFHGRSAVHTHMTNTRITDPEILENRYPVILREFSIRRGSGGEGRWHGGDGVVRSLQFRRPLSLSLLTERRSFQPYGLEGGSPGARGLNLLKRGSRIVNLGGKITTDVLAGDILTINSPGGGGFG